MISIECNDYQYKGKTENNSYCKTYRYYYDNEVYIRKYCKVNKINIYTKENNIPNIYTLVEKFGRIYSFEINAVKFSSKLFLLKPENYSKAKFEDYLIGCLYLNYPELEHYQDLVRQINETYYAGYPEMQITFEPRIT